MSEAEADLVCPRCHKCIRAGIFEEHNLRCFMLCQLRALRQRHAYQEQAIIDSLPQQRAANFSCRRLSWRTRRHAGALATNLESREAVANVSELSERSVPREQHCVV
eukprot:Skav233846  [mRNA]  locus=scaffold3130:105002:115512:- [translate_table: standard]